MTALHPLESKVVVKGVHAWRYPINEVCGFPDCDKPTESRHHIFAAGKIGNRSWFVYIPDPDKPLPPEVWGKHAIPHVVGLCGHGTAGHHGEAEEHQAWIKYEDGVFVWYNRDGEEWKKIGPLDPQPGSKIKHTRPKKRDHRSDGAPRHRTRYTIAIPKDAQEDGAEVPRRSGGLASSGGCA